MSADAQSGDRARIFEHGEAALSQGRLDEAERDFQQVLRLDPQNDEARRLLAELHHP